MPRNTGPGPGIYKLPPTVGYANHDVRKLRNPQYSIGHRTEQQEGRNSLGPGPGAYNVQNLTRYGHQTPNMHTLAPRFELPRGFTTPGPGAHENHKCPDMRWKRPPMFSMGHRTMVNFNEVKPAPNRYSYNINVIKSSSPKFSIGARTDLIHKDFSPGPAQYGRVDPRVIVRAQPAFSIGKRTSIVCDKTQKPAPNAYNLQKYKPRCGPAYIFGIKHSEDAPPFIVPCDNCRCR